MLLVVVATCQPQPFIFSWEEKHVGSESSCENSIFFFLENPTQIKQTAAQNPPRAASLLCDWLQITLIGRVNTVMLMHCMTLRVRVHSIVSIPCMNIVCMYTWGMEDIGGALTHSHELSPAEHGGQEELRALRIVCGAKEKRRVRQRERKERTWTKQTEEGKQKKSHSHSYKMCRTLNASASDVAGLESERIYMCRGAKVSVSVDFPLQNEVSPYMLHVFPHRFTQSIIWARLNTRAVNYQQVKLYPMFVC